MRRLLVLLIFSAVLVVGCVQVAPPTTPPAAISAEKTVAIGGAFHDIHTKKLALQCTQCHAQKVEVYSDPLAQVANLADRRACIGCHKEGTAKPWYGEEWTKESLNK